MKPTIRLHLFCMTVFAILFLLNLHQVSACDSSMLEILTGKSTQQELTRKILAVSQKMQQTGSLLNSFNIAAARKQHHEVMENWLNIASQIATLPEDDANAETTARLMMQIAQNLGQVRRQLDSDDLKLIHENLEACITRISLVSAILNGHMQMRRFLELELAVFELGPALDEPGRLKEITASSSLLTGLQEFCAGMTGSSSAGVEKIRNAFETFKITLNSDEQALSQHTSEFFQQIKNHFIAFKKQLLNANFFSRP